MIKQKDMGSMRVLPVGIGIGMLVSLMITLILSVAVGWMISGEHLQEDSIDFGVIIIQLISAVAGAAAAYTLIKSRRLFVCLAAGGGYYLLLLACTALFFGGQYEGMAISVLVILSGCLLVGLLGLKGKRTGAVNRRKFKNR